MNYVFEIIDGVEGECLSFGNGKTGYRLSGPKPRGGGDVIKSFSVNLRSLKALQTEIRNAIKKMEKK